MEKTTGEQKYSTAIGEGIFKWVELGGCVNRPIRELWAAFEGETLIRWKGSKKGFHLQKIPAKNGAHHSFKASYKGGTDWETIWNFTVAKGTPEDPGKIIIKYENSTHGRGMKHWKGSVVLTKVDESVTSVFIRNEFDLLAVAQLKVDEEQKSFKAAKELFEEAKTAKPNWEYIKAPKTQAPPSFITDFHCQKNKNAKALPSKDFLKSEITENFLTLTRSGSCVNAPIQRLWSALRITDFLHWKGSDKITSQPLEAPYPWIIDSHEINYTKFLTGFDVPKIKIPHFDVAVGLQKKLRQSWKMIWTHKLIEGSFKNPKQVIIKYEKVLGLEDITTWKGQIVLTQVTGQITSVDIKNYYEEVFNIKFNTQKSFEEKNVEGNESLVLELLEQIRQIQP